MAERRSWTTHKVRGSSRTLSCSSDKLPCSKPTAWPHFSRRSLWTLNWAARERDSLPKSFHESNLSRTSKQVLKRPASPKIPTARPRLRHCKGLRFPGVRPVNRVRYNDLERNEDILSVCAKTNSCQKKRGFRGILDYVCPHVHVGAM